MLEELRAIYDTSGGYYSGGKYHQSIYSEVADVIELEIEKGGDGETIDLIVESEPPDVINKDDDDLQICPECGAKALKVENGCSSCLECGESKCGG